MQTLLQRAIEVLDDGEFRPASRSQYLAVLRQLGIENEPVELLTKAWASSHTQRILNVNSRRAAIIAFRTLFDIKLKIPLGESKSYELPDYDYALDVISSYKHSMLPLMMLRAGARLGETLIKQPAKGNVITIDRQITKEGSFGPAKTTGPVIVPQEFADLYADFEPPSISHAAVQESLKRLSIRTTKDFNAAALRSLFANRLVKAGAPPDVLKRQMRHSSVTTSLRFYVQTTQQDIEAVVGRI